MKKTLAEKVDYIFNKVLPKKFIVLCICTYFVARKVVVPPEYWEVVKFYMIGGQVATTANLITRNIKRNE